MRDRRRVTRTPLRTHDALASILSAAGAENLRVRTKRTLAPGWYERGGRTRWSRLAAGLAVDVLPYSRTVSFRSPDPSTPMIQMLETSPSRFDENAI